MLTYLHVQNFALIDDLTLDIYPGLTVLTGETGAGKSIIIEALSLLLGERALSEQVRSGKDSALIEGIFHLDENAFYHEYIMDIISGMGIDVDNELIISREISRAERNICRLNGRVVPVQSLKNISQYLVDLHGQHHHQSILNSVHQLELLDNYGGSELLNKRDAVKKKYNELKEINSQLKAVGSGGDDFGQQLEILQYQLEEIRQANLSKVEEEELQQRQLILENTEKIIETTSRAYQDIYKGDDCNPAVLDIIAYHQKEIFSLSQYDPALIESANFLDDIGIQLTEMARDLRNYFEQMHLNPEEQSQIDDRLNIYRKMKNKYGRTIEEVSNTASDLEKKVNFIIKNKEKAKNFHYKKEEIIKCLHHKAEELSLQRNKTADRLEQELFKIFKQLALSKAKLKVSFKKTEDIMLHGQDKVDFLFSANPGEPLKPLSKIISGGEASRVMLALKTILASKDQIPTLIFDEIDSGIGGITLQAVAEKLAALSQYHQVVCITHNPQIASMADNHYCLYKEEKNGRMVTKALFLDNDSRRREIARMLDGDKINSLTLNHVQALIERADLFKKDLNYQN